MNTFGTAYPKSESAFKAALHNGHPLVLMLTMGKVASKTIGRSLEGGRYAGAIAHAHTIRPKGQCSPGELGPEHPDPRFRMAFHWLREKKMTCIISPVRRSLDRNIADFFFNYERTRQDVLTIHQHSMDRLITLFYAYTPHLWHAYWFDNVLKPFTGIDVYGIGDHKAPTTRVHRNGNVQVLVFRVEEPDQIKIRAVKDFLGMQSYSLTQHNRAVNSSYAPVYRKFRAEFRPSPEYLDLLESTRYHKHFYPLP